MMYVSKHDQVTVVTVEAMRLLHVCIAVKGMLPAMPLQVLFDTCLQQRMGQGGGIPLLAPAAGTGSDPIQATG